MLSFDNNNRLRSKQYSKRNIYHLKKFDENSKESFLKSELGYFNNPHQSNTIKHD